MKCPICYKEINDNAVFCKYCGYRLVQDPDPAPAPEPKPAFNWKPVLIAALAVIVAGAGVAAFFLSKGNTRPDNIHLVNSPVSETADPEKSLIAVPETTRGIVVSPAYYNYELSYKSKDFLDDILAAAKRHCSIDEMTGLILDTPQMQSFMEEAGRFREENQIESPESDLTIPFLNTHYLVFKDYKFAITYYVSDVDDTGYYLLFILPLQSGEGCCYEYRKRPDISYELFFGECQDGMFNGHITGEYYEDFYGIEKGTMEGEAKNGLMDGEWEETFTLIPQGENSEIPYNKTCTFSNGQAEYEKYNDDAMGGTAYGCGRIINLNTSYESYYEIRAEDFYNKYYVNHNAYNGLGTLDMTVAVSGWEYYAPKDADTVRIGY